jgi:tripartite-type tricarboxylate transporter receptor subunit TctC
MMRLARICATIFAGGLLTCSVVASAQAQKTLKIVVPYPPGGSADIQARLLAQEISQSKGQPTVVENRPGAGTILATEAVARAAPDGTTALLIANAFVINPHIRKLSYDPLTNFAPICQLVVSPQVIVVNSDSPYRTLKDLIDAARSKPGEITLGSSGPVTGQHIAVAMFLRAANVNMIYVPFAGGLPSVNAVLGGHVTAIMANLIEVSEQLASGKLRALATTSRERIEALPDLPTVAESGYPDYAITGWVGVVAPGPMPKATLAQMVDFFGAAVRSPEVKSKLAAQGLYPVGLCGEAFGSFLREEYDKYGRIIRDANIRPN